MDVEGEGGGGGGEGSAVRCSTTLFADTAYILAESRVAGDELIPVHHYCDPLLLRHDPTS